MEKIFFPLAQMTLSFRFLKCVGVGVNFSIYSLCVQWYTCILKLLHVEKFLAAMHKVLAQQNPKVVVHS